MADAARLLATPTPAPIAIHASAVAVGERAAILRGPSGAGKSTFALALLARARDAGLFAQLVADDRTLLRRAGDQLVVSPHPVIAGQIERRFVGITTLPHLDAALATLVVDLLPAHDTPGVARMPRADAGWTVLAGVRLARLSVPITHPGAVDTVLDHLRSGTQ